MARILRDEPRIDGDVKDSRPGAAAASRHADVLGLPTGASANGRFAG
jgi:hypothetical protein